MDTLNFENHSKTFFSKNLNAFSFNVILNLLKCSKSILISLIEGSFLFFYMTVFQK